MHCQGDNLGHMKCDPTSPLRRKIYVYVFRRYVHAYRHYLYTYCNVHASPLCASTHMQPACICKCTYRHLHISKCIHLHLCIVAGACIYMLARARRLHQAYGDRCMQPHVHVTWTHLPRRVGGWLLRSLLIYIYVQIDRSMDRQIDGSIDRLMDGSIDRQKCRTKERTIQKDRTKDITKERKKERMKGRTTERTK